MAAKSLDPRRLWSAIAGTTHRRGPTARQGTNHPRVLRAHMWKMDDDGIGEDHHSLVRRPSFSSPPLTTHTTTTV